MRGSGTSRPAFPWLRLERIDKDETRNVGRAINSNYRQPCGRREKLSRGSNSLSSLWSFLGLETGRSLSPPPSPPRMRPTDRPTAALSFPSGHENFDSPIMRHERGISFPHSEYRIRINSSRGGNWRTGYLEWIFQIFMNNWWTHNRVKWDERFRGDRIICVVRWNERKKRGGMKINFWLNLQYFGIFNVRKGAILQMYTARFRYLEWLNRSKIVTKICFKDRFDFLLKNFESL